MRDPTRAARNFRKQSRIGESFRNWAASRGQPLIAGHTHKPMFADPGQALYFNTGSCVHPRCITGIEISDGAISLIKWSVELTASVDRDFAGTLQARRSVIMGPQPLSRYSGA